MAQLELRSLGKSFGAYKVFEGLDLAVEAGEIVVIFGGSGTGKTILLRLIAGVEEPTSGTIRISGDDVADIAPEHRNVGMAFQNFALFPHLSAFDNIATPLVARQAAAETVKAGVTRVARLLKIEHVLTHAPRELSNGQKQRTALARALVADPKLLLLDDPLRNVDAKLRFEMRLELPRLLRQSNSTVLYVTQDYKEAMALGDRIAILSGGKFVQVATPELIYRRPAAVGVARLFGDPAINLFDTDLRKTGKSVAAPIAGGYIVLAAEFGEYAGKAVTLGIRPEAITIAKDGLAAEVAAVTPLNERTVLLLTGKGGAELLASLPSSSAAIPKAGQTVKLGFDPRGLHLFDRASGARLAGSAG